MSMSDVKDFAETKHDGLPEKVEENVIRLTENDLRNVVKESVNILLREGKWLPREEWLKQQAAQREARKKNVCAFNNYEDVTPDMVNRFWSQSRYAEGLVPMNYIRPEFQPAYEKAKKNVAMLDYAMSPSYTVYLDREANLYILVNTGASWSLQNHLSHYAGRCRGYFSLDTAGWAQTDPNEWELLYTNEP
jgi:hypothetical protein